LTFSEHERAILTAMEMDGTAFTVDDRLRVISNAMLEMSNNDKSVITVQELKQLTVQRLQQKICDATAFLEGLEHALKAIQSKIDEINDEKDEYWITHPTDRIMFQKEFHTRKSHLLIEIETARRILERRETVHKSYLEMTERIDEIIQSAKASRTGGNSPSDSAGSSDGSASDSASSDGTEDGDEMDIDSMINQDKMCPICYCPFCENIVLFVKCRHYFCQGCFERCHKQRPNTCPMCRSPAEIGEINYIGLENRVITSTKNTEILRLLHSQPGERFLIFTRFDKFITPLTAFLAINDIAAKTFDEFKASSQETRDATRVILLSANSNASGTDMTFMNQVIIIEPFDSYIYGKEIEKQLIGRLHRINQTRDVHVHRLYIRDTIEEQIYALG
jgi:Zinc finger, C3HC4 type (RING finger)